MTAEELAVEHKHIYETRLAIMGAFLSSPTAEQHNLAVSEADAHISALKAQPPEGLEELLALRDQLA